MSDFTVIGAVSRSLKALLVDHVTNSTEPQVPKAPIDLRSPKEMAGTKAISLWLYRVIRDGELLNAPPRRPSPTQQARPALPMDLYYLITPIKQDPETEQFLLGRVLQVFNDHAILRGSYLQPPLVPGTDELRLTLETLSLEDLTRVWHALHEPYQLSVSYLVQAVTIDSHHPPVQVAPVIEKQTQYTQILSVS
jgi:hypothetical protein